MRVQQFVRLVTARFTQELFVDGLDGRVFVGFTDRHLSIGAVDSFPTGLDDVGVTVVERLACTVDTTTRTSSTNGLFTPFVTCFHTTMRR